MRIFGGHYTCIEEGELPEMPIYLAALIMCSGFFMMYLVEELVHLYIHSREDKLNEKVTDVLSKKRPSEDVADSVESQEDRNLGSKRLSTHFPAPTGRGDSVVSALRGLLIVLALSIHELFEGLAVGLESSAGNVW